VFAAHHSGRITLPETTDGDPAPLDPVADDEDDDERRRDAAAAERLRQARLTRLPSRPFRCTCASYSQPVRVWLKRERRYLWTCRACGHPIES
jgi:hypothetical protein